MATGKFQLDPEQALEENARLREELQRARAIAQAAAEELQGFVYAASHDVKEALRSVISYSQLLVRHAPPDPELAEYGQFVADGVKSAIAILDRMNAFARIDVSARKTPIALSIPLEMALLKMQPAIRDSGIVVTRSSLPEANINESQFALLFENLIDNAIQYRGPDRPCVEIMGEETGDGCLVSVRDNGVGIPSAYQQLVFQPFKRLHGKEFPGIGLGLAMCAKIALAHDGRLWVESDGVNGSVFKILIPF
jgi:signal transduction histidine kinase